MTVQTSTNVAGFVGNGATTSFPIGFKFNSSADLIVESTNTITGITTTLSLNSDYTAQGAGDESGGTITFTTAPLSVETVKVTRRIDLLQLTDLRNQGKFYAEIHEDVFDRLIMIDQQQQTEINDANAKSDDAVATANAADAKADQAVAKADQNLVDMQAQYDAFEQGAALVVIGDYATGLVVDGYNKIFRKDGEFYRAKAELALPYSLTGDWAVDAPNFVSVGDAVLRQELSNGTEYMVDSLRVGHDGESLGTILNRDPFAWVRKYGLALDGVTDDAPALRLALDDMPAGGGELHFPPGSQVKIVGTVFIPQRIPTVGVEGQGVRLIGNNSQIIGDGASVIFESGTGQFSTVSLGGATNWTQPDEGAGTIHYNSAIIGFNFKDCSTPIKLKNWLHGCVLEKLYATNFTERMIWTDRCFYLAQRDIQGRPFREDRADSMPIFQYDDTNNTMTFDSVHGSGISPAGQSKGIVFQFDGGVQGVELPAGCSAEGAKVGVHLKSIIYSMAIMGVYFELCDEAIKSTAANLNNLVIDYCEFEDNIVDINVDNWIDGYYGSANKNEGAVVFGPGCTHAVHLPSQTLTNLNHSSWVAAPAGWTVSGGCQVHRNDYIFNSDVGFSAPWFRHSSDSSGATGIVPLSYTGECFNVGGIIPFCSVSLSSGTMTIDTKIRWNPNLSTVRFDILVAHSQQDVISGVLTCGNTVRLDAGSPAAITVTASDNGGMLRLVLSGFSVSGISGYSGKVRVI
ncbi:hypothetical protein JQR85_13490 [Stutzerimonas urumqiensis]|uniref:hypothetical protein n=1 Tax=Stutzerimonas urumqiensis TaxID=638269 RepID=UPI003DA388C8